MYENVKKLEQLYEGKAKKVFATSDPDLVLVSYKDDATAFNGLKKGQILGKGSVNNRASNMLFRMLEAKGIPTHYVKELSDTETLVKKVKGGRLPKQAYRIPGRRVFALSRSRVLL